MDLTTIPVIAILCYFIIQIIKKTFTKLDTNYLPFISGGLGIAFSVGGFYGFPSWFVGLTLLQVIIMGAASGLTAVGSNQIWKKLKAILKIVDINVDTDDTDDIIDDLEKTDNKSKDDKSKDDESKDDTTEQK